MKEHYIEVDGKEYTIFVGRDKNENDKLLKESAQNDLWFHLEDQSSPHIVLKNDFCEAKVPKRCLNYVGTLFQHYKGKLAKHYTVIWTEIKNVKCTDEPGTVIPSKLRKIRY